MRNIPVSKTRQDENNKKDYIMANHVDTDVSSSRQSIVESLKKSSTPD